VVARKPAARTVLRHGKLATVRQGPCEHNARVAHPPQRYEGHWKELPAEWIEGLDVARMVASPKYREGVNNFGVKCGQSLEAWHEKGWIVAQDPAGWFHWYCRFYRGRRTDVSDARPLHAQLQPFPGPPSHRRATAEPPPSDR